MDRPRRKLPIFSAAAVAYVIAIAAAAIFTLLTLPPDEPSRPSTARVAQGAPHRIAKLRSAAVLPRSAALRLLSTPKGGRDSRVAAGAFDKEQTMSFRQLMKRWDLDVAEASRRFSVPPAWIRAVMQL